MRSYIIHKFHLLDDVRLSSNDLEAEGLYARLYRLAGVLDADGLFIENGRVLSYDEIAYRIRIEKSTVLKLIKRLEKMNIIHVNGKGPQIVDWKHEQIDLNIKRERDRGYQAKHRAGQTVSDDVSPDKELSATVSDIERETQTQIKTKTLSLLKGHVEILKQHPEWLDEAIEIASQMDKLTPAYIAGIVKNWITEGRTPKGVKRAKSNYVAGNPKRTDKPKPAQANYTDSDREAAKRVLAKRAKANV